MERMGQFDAGAFHAALDGQRQSRGITWKKVAEESEVSASTLTRMAQGRRPDVDSLARLTTWSGLKADDFIVGKRNDGGPQPDPLAQITALLRADANLSQDAATAIEAAIKTLYERLRGDQGP